MCRISLWCNLAASMGKYRLLSILIFKRIVTKHMECRLISGNQMIICRGNEISQKIDTIYYDTLSSHNSIDYFTQLEYGTDFNAKLERHLIQSLLRTDAEEEIYRSKHVKSFEVAFSEIRMAMPKRRLIIQCNPDLERLIPEA